MSKIFNILPISKLAAMSTVTFFDLETEPSSDHINDIGCIRSDGGRFHRKSIHELLEFIKHSDFLCGHNIFKHDLKYLQKFTGVPDFGEDKSIDTLYISPLLFPKRPYHKLLKDDKLLAEEINNPLHDSLKAKELFDSLTSVFLDLPEDLKCLYYNLTGSEKEFRNFFRFLNYHNPVTNEQLKTVIGSTFSNNICSSAPLNELIDNSPIALCYALALINTVDSYSITPPWVLHNYPEVERVIYLLRGRPCIQGCTYCNESLDIQKALKRYFGFDRFRKYGEEPLQEKAVNAAIQQKSILAVFPTGGGKSITFQLPALMAGENEKALTVVISPLQSLMKDQVDNLEKKSITAAVTINGMLDPIDRQHSIQRVEGDVPDKALANILYLSPESLRSVTIERLLLKRKIARFVIDEAHCFSSWGQDFRVDYLYIGDFIRNLQQQKGIEENIPVSCFTATAKLKVIEDIQAYFKAKLGLELQLLTADTGRTNLHYKVFNEEDPAAKYLELRRLLEKTTCPTIIYVSRTKKAVEIATQLNADGFTARAFHGKMDKDEKKANQDAFINGEINIMVATSAFGMGVDKSDVGMVIHYQISDSLENYVQEAGRAGRDEKIEADCYVLYNEDDLDKHFQLLNQTKLDVKEINQIWRAIKEMTKTRASLSNSALEIARKAGWDENIKEIETRVTTAIAALEDAGYVKRGRNMPRVFANSISTKNAQEAVNTIGNSEIIPPHHKQNAIRIIKKLFSSKSKRLSTEETAESRIDYIADQLGMRKKDVLEIIELLKQENILGDFKDITVFIGSNADSNRSLNTLEKFSSLENFLLSKVNDETRVYNLKELNQKSEEQGCKNASVTNIHTILNFWAVKDWVNKSPDQYSRNHVTLKLTQTKPRITEKLERRHIIARTIVQYLYQKDAKPIARNEPDDRLVEFSIQELRVVVHQGAGLFRLHVTNEDIEDTLLFLSRIEALKIEGGFLVTYNRLSIERIEQNNKIQYKNEDYQKLDQYYKNKVQQIHIVGEYARKMIENYNDALQFVDDYFKLNYSSFLNKYFRGQEKNIRRPMTRTKFNNLFGSLSPAQLEIIHDKDSNNILVAAGPGSGKTRVLVHKLASVLLTEDVKPEQLLMLTFSRAAATEFKKRLVGLIGAAAHYVDIKTFHSYCFDICGQVGDLEHAEEIVPMTCNRITDGEIEPSRITKTFLVVDEAQDISAEEYNLITILMEKNEDMRVILVGDDDQNIYEFRKSSSEYMLNFMREQNAKKYELVDNYRSRTNIVDFGNHWVTQIQHRLKEFPIVAKDQRNGEIRIIQYSSPNLISPLVQSVFATELAGTTTVLTRTNEEAELIAGMLKNHGADARLIQSNDGFNLSKLKELKYFTDLIHTEPDAPVISEEIWEQSIRALNNSFAESDKLSWCAVLIKRFSEINSRIKYKSDWKVFLEESRLEDFVEIIGDIIYVSTMHKSKGKEFDNVFVMLEGLQPSTDADKRLLYVACTRAKKRLQIHYNGTYLKFIKTNELTYETNNFIHPEPQYISRALNYADVQLGYFRFVQHRLNSIRSGTSLSICKEGLMNSNGELVIKFSKAFSEQIQKWVSRGYYLETAKNNFSVFWKDKEVGEDVEIILPELTFKKSASTI